MTALKNKQSLCLCEPSVVMCVNICMCVCIKHSSYIFHIIDIISMGKVLFKFPFSTSTQLDTIRKGREGSQGLKQPEEGI